MKVKMFAATTVMKRKKRNAAVPITKHYEIAALCVLVHHVSAIIFLLLHLFQSSLLVHNNIANFHGQITCMSAPT